jgi:hypothetical protein
MNDSLFLYKKKRELSVLIDMFMASIFLGIKPLNKALFRELKPTFKVNSINDLYKSILKRKNQ